MKPLCSLPLFCWISCPQFFFLVQQSHVIARTCLFIASLCCLTTMFPCLITLYCLWAHIFFLTVTHFRVMALHLNKIVTLLFCSASFTYRQGNSKHGVVYHKFMLIRKLTICMLCIMNLHRYGKPHTYDVYHKSILTSKLTTCCVW